MHKSIDKILEQLMKHHGVSQVALKEGTGVSQSTISRILKPNGPKGIREPTDKQVKRLADFFGLSTDQLRGHQALPDSCFDNLKPVPQGDAPSTLVSNVMPAYFKENRRYPVISWVQAGDWSEAIDIFQPGFADHWETSDCNTSDSSFWLRVVGDSMTAPTGLSIPEGHLILVDPEAQPENGSLVIAKLTESEEVTFKKLVIDAGQHYLKPLNPNYHPIKINGSCRIVGVVKEAKIKL